MSRWRSSGAIIRRGDEELDLDPVIPGFRCKTSELFPPSLEEMATAPTPA